MSEEYEAKKSLLKEINKRIEQRNNNGNYPLTSGSNNIISNSSLLYKNLKPKKRINLTVCIAAICESSSIFGISDRMITHGDIEFEPASSKVIQITSSIVSMIAGDTAFQTEILLTLIQHINSSEKSQDHKWSVEDIAYLYIDCKQRIERKKCEINVLKPFGLTHESFLSRQHELSEAFINYITNAIQHYYQNMIPDTETIITGIDATGPHIYVINNNYISCYDKIGFASIGSGARHAESQFMLAGYTFNFLLHDALLITYIAKKRSEIAPGVGSGSDMFMIDTSKSCYIIKDEVMDNIDKIYQNITQKETKIHEEAKTEAKKYIEEIPKSAPRAQYCRN